MKQIVVYGSLREGEYNADRFRRNYGAENFKYIRTTTITGYNIFDLGSYPGLKISNDPNSKVIVDIMEVSDECFQSIEWMEHGAGYSTIKVVDDETGQKFPAYMYEYSATDLVESGDWVKYQNQLEKI